MKKTLLFIALLCAAGLVFGQQSLNYKQNLKQASMPDRSFSEPAVQNTNQVHYAPPKAPAQSDNSRSIIVRQIGGAANGFSMLGVRQYLWADNNINSVCFTHRMPASPGSGYVAYDYSTDGGVTFTNNIQVYDPTLIDGFNARYPQGGIYNPAGNTDPANAAFGYFAPTLDGSTGSGTWGGYAYGTQMFANSSGPSQHNLTSEGQFMQEVPDSYTITSQGLAVAIEASRVELVYSDNMIVTKGYFNPETNEFEMEREIVEMPAGGESIAGVIASVADEKIAFSPDGMIGYIGYLSNNGENDDNSDGCYYPILYKTMDGGESWDGPFNVQLGGEDGIQTILNFLTDEIIAEMFEVPVPEREDIPFTTGFEFGLTVDHSGNPHLLFDVGVGSQEWSIFSAYGGNAGCEGCVAMTHIYSTDGGESWIGDTLCTVKTFRGDFPWTGGDPSSEDNRPYVASTMDGSKLFFSWIDTDIPDIGDNISPDIFCIGYDVINNTYSQNANVTFLTNAMWNAYMACGSKYVFDHGDGTYTIPFAYQEINTEELLDPVQFFYIDNYVLSDADLAFTTGVEKPQTASHQLSNNFPNPCSDVTRMSLYLENSSVVSYNISNLLGQVIWNGAQTKLSRGNHVLTLDVSSLKTGVYLYNVTVDGKTQTGKMLVN